jgi:hypothetical protein
MRTELEQVQRDFRYAAVNELYPGLITAHLVDVPRRNAVQIVAYFNIDGQILRLDDEVYYETIESTENVNDLIVGIIDLRVREYKEKNK